MNPKWQKLTNLELIELKRKKSFEHLASIFEVSVATVKRRYYKLVNPKTNLEINEENSMKIALAIEGINEAADLLPKGFFRQELYATCKRIREAMDFIGKKKLVLAMIENGKSEIVEICETTHFHRQEVELIIADLLAEKKIYQTLRGSHANKGRKSKYLYFVR